MKKLHTTKILRVTGLDVEAMSSLRRQSSVRAGRNSTRQLILNLYFYNFIWADVPGLTGYEYPVILNIWSLPEIFMTDNYKWDVFLSHASEDKEDFVRPLATKLKENNIKAWYDEFEIQWGDSIRESIDEGLKKSKFAIIVLSKNFFQKSWASNELNGYFTFDSKEAKRILPIWYNVTKEDVANYSPILADRLGVDPKEGIEGIVQKVKKRLNLDFTPPAVKSSPTPSILQREITWETLGTYTIFRFGFLGIDQFWQAKLFEDINGNSKYKTLVDVDNAIKKAAIAIALYAKENPDAFESGTDFITKAIGFVDLDFRKVHDFSKPTLAAFEKYKTLLIHN